MKKTLAVMGFVAVAACGCTGGWGGGKWWAWSLQYGATALGVAADLTTLGLFNLATLLT